MFSWPRLSAFDPLVLDCLTRANGEWAGEIQAQIIQGECVAVLTEFGVAVFRDEGDECCAVSYAGSNYAGILAEWMQRLKGSKFTSFRIHSDNPAMVRMWRKLSIKPNEWVFRGTV